MLKNICLLELAFGMTTEFQRMLICIAADEGSGEQGLKSRLESRTGKLMSASCQIWQKIRWFEKVHYETLFSKDFVTN